EDVVVISCDKVKGSGDWNSSEFQDTAISGKKKDMVFYQMDTEEVPCFVNGLDAYDGEINLRVEENMISSKKAIAIRMSRKFALLEEERPIIETMAYNDKYKKILDEVWKDKVKLDGKIVKEEKDAAKRIKGEALKEKDDPRVFVFPIRLKGRVKENALANIGSDIHIMPYRTYETLEREDMKKVDRGIMMINHTQAEAMGILLNI
nr:hypothetical protein [Tanacetum cinerariifolium]